MTKTAPKNNTQENKSRMSLVPFDLLSELLVPAYEEGVIKYKRESWRDGFHTTVMMDACFRHLSKFYYEGEDLDPEAIERFGIEKQHLGAAIFCLVSIYNTLKTRPELDDRFTKEENPIIKGKEKVCNMRNQGSHSRISKLEDNFQEKQK